MITGKRGVAWEKSGWLSGLRRRAYASAGRISVIF